MSPFSICFLTNPSSENGGAADSLEGSTPRHFRAPFPVTKGGCTLHLVDQQPTTERRTDRHFWGCFFLDLREKDSSIFRVSLEWQKQIEFHHMELLVESSLRSARFENQWMIKLSETSCGEFLSGNPSLNTIIN